MFSPRSVALCAAGAAMSLFFSAQALAQNFAPISAENRVEDNTPKFVRFAENVQFDQNQSTKLFSDVFGLDGTQNTMVHKHTTHTKNGLSSVRYTQHYKGIEVRFGGATLAVKDNAVKFVTANYFKFDHNPAAVPSLAETEALEKALAFVGASVYQWQLPTEELFLKKRSANPDTSFKPKGKLVWIDDHAVGDRKAHLAYSFDIYAAEPLSRQEVFVDAISGKILFSNALIKHATASGASRYSGTVSFYTGKITPSKYILFDSTRGDGIYTLNLNNSTTYSSAVDFSSPTNTWPTSTAHKVALDAHWGTEKVYDYWLSEHGRYSWDDLNGMLLSYVHYGSGYNNAFWNGTCMTYGDGSGSPSGFDPLTALDVTAHEIGHGVCSATCDLVYEKESGAMNEGLSDCWGATIEHFGDPFEVDGQPKKYWYIGEELQAGTPLRRMDFPKLRNNPDTYGGTYWTSVTSCTPTPVNDYCGVHNNSGVLNKFFYLLTAGGAGTNDKGNVYSVTGLGWTKAPLILYNTELLLTPYSTFADCRSISINVTQLLYGSCSPEMKSVTDAWYAVGVGTSFAPCVSFIGFDKTVMDVAENGTASGCGAATVYKIGLKPYGVLFTGGMPVAIVDVVGGTAVAGRAYAMPTSSVSFPLGSSATQYVSLTVYDNGTVGDGGTIKLAFNLIPGGSNAYIETTFDTLTVNLNNNDTIPNAGTAVATSAFASRAHFVYPNDEAYFYNQSDNRLIAGVRNGPSYMGCVQTSLSASGNGFASASFSPLKRSRKEVSMLGITAGSTGELSIYFTNAELAGSDPASLKLLLTTAVTDADIARTNTKVVKPTVTPMGGYVAFSYNFTALTGSFRLFLTDDTLCVPPTAATVTPASATTVCTGETVTLNANNGAGYTYQWMKDGTDIPGATSVKYTATTAGKYTVRVGSPSGCYLSSTAVTVTVLPLPKTFTVSGAGNYCVGKEFAVKLSGSETGVQYTLYRNSVNTGTSLAGTGDTLRFTNLTQAGNYSISAKNTATGCSAPMSGNADITLTEAPVVTVTPSGTIDLPAQGQTLLSAEGAKNCTYQWFNGNDAIQGAQDSAYMVAAAGNYRVVVNNGTCTDTSDVVIVNISETMSLSLMPNPNNGVFSVKGKLKNNFEGEASIIISDAGGRIIHTVKINVLKGFVDAHFALDNLAKAVYTVKVVAGTEEAVFRMSAF